MDVLFGKKKVESSKITVTVVLFNDNSFLLQISLPDGIPPRSGHSMVAVTLSPSLMAVSSFRGYKEADRDDHLQEATIIMVRNHRLGNRLLNEGMIKFMFQSLRTRIGGLQYLVCVCVCDESMLIYLAYLILMLRVYT